MTILVTGAAGFIGYHLAEALLESGREVLGLDNLNAYYDPALKRARLARLKRHERFTFHQLDLADSEAVLRLAEGEARPEVIVHLAAQAGVRYSLTHPFTYAESNLTGQLSMLELARRLPDLRHFVYASSSSVYGGNKKVPYSVEDRADHPVSLYAATKRAGELMADTYAHLYGIRSTGLRFFTVYGPWGRPDMATFIFTKAIFEGTPLKVFNFGKMRRDFTYIDDVIAGTLAAMEAPPGREEGRRPHNIYNLGNHRSEDLERFIAILEQACGRKAIKEYLPMQPGDVDQTYADITSAGADLGFAPKMTIEEGLPKFVAWYRDYYGVGEDLSALGSDPVAS
jgi:UDP-glucuronate 4-epimerase